LDRQPPYRRGWTTAGASVGPPAAPGRPQRYELLADVAAGRDQEAQGVKVAELADRWLDWCQPPSPWAVGVRDEAGEALASAFHGVAGGRGLIVKVPS
jgi:hypothetical protein